MLVAVALGAVAAAAYTDDIVDLAAAEHAEAAAASTELVVRAAEETVDSTAVPAVVASVCKLPAVAVDGVAAELAVATAA